MTGAILGGSSVNQAAKLQMVIMFMISASTTLGSIVTTILALVVVVDGQHRIRSDRVDERPNAVSRAKTWFVDRVLKRIWAATFGRKIGGIRLENGEEHGLLG